MKLRKSPFSLPPDQYGGARKRTFIGLMLASCVVLCLGLAIFLILPWSNALNGVVWLERLSIIVGLVCITALMWLCLMLVFHIYTGKALPGAGSVRHVTVRLFFPLMELLAKFVGIDRGSVRRSFIKVNNELVLSRRKTVEPHKLLLLLPHCVQRSTCPHRLVHNADLCLRCGIATGSFLLAVNRCTRHAPFTSIDVSSALDGAHVAELADGGREVEELLGAGMAQSLVEASSPLCISIEGVLDELLPLASRPASAGVQAPLARIGLAPKADAGLRGKQRKRKGRASRREAALAKGAS